MKIAQLASSVESVPPAGYGGTEIVVNLLTEELVEQGHEVTLFASGDSKTAARLVSITEHSMRADHSIPQSRWAAYDIRTLLKLEEMQDQFDIIHNHMSWQALPFLANLRKPVVTTNHNPIRDYCKDIYFAYRELPYVSISDAYRRLNHPEGINYIGTVYNGINLDDYRYQRDKEGEYLLFLGRICHDKGTRESIQIARALDLPLKIAGKIDRRDQEYFDSEVKPELGKNGIEYVGEVDLLQKNELYRNAIAVTYPINFDEPFGLVMAEAMACGVPLLALERGSVKEVLEDGTTAIVGNSVEELIRRFPELKKIRPENCRLRVEKLFDKAEMVRNYIKIYEQVIEFQDSEIKQKA